MELAIVGPAAGNVTVTILSRIIKEINKWRQAPCERIHILKDSGCKLKVVNDLVESIRNGTSGVDVKITANIQKALEALRDEIRRIKAMSLREYRRTSKECKDNLRRLLYMVDEEEKSLSVRIAAENMRLMTTNLTIRQNEQAFHDPPHVDPHSADAEDLKISKPVQVPVAACLASAPGETIFNKPYVAEDLNSLMPAHVPYVVGVPRVERNARIEKYCAEDLTDSKPAQVPYLGSVPRDIYTRLEPYCAEIPVKCSTPAHDPIAACLDVRFDPCCTEEMNPSNQVQVPVLTCLDSFPRDIHKRMEPYCAQDSNHSTPASFDCKGVPGAISGR